ncbi:MAG: 30S ribosomal protein S9 [Candidatus Omnitrophica bacterium]|nr:30S ribosomal protein S9 [Candidatus Omnitrophota bacterium]
MKIIHATGKRKTARARATLRDGDGVIKINKVLVDNIQTEMLRLKVKEVVNLSEDLIKKINIDVIVQGGGVNGQIEAARQAIAKGLVVWSKSNKLKETFARYDKSLLVYDPRRTEPHKESRSCKGPRRKRQSSKR